ncbi:DNA replication/repair protein RecF [uncultured Cocleimonas sp.]|uniref:DNA replication/repair protein RecF n=1 Tax=uncultured Cocleimonas sp. TaxID=1051587 RepID=UPI0026285C99|nr:DNA replication and repair protein RecF [uncultured Cocleimonas sp.]
MWIQKLNIKNVRSIEDESLDFCPGFNIIIGDNASGKTSLLESLSLLSSGRSFRSAHISEVIKHKQSSALVNATLNNNNSSIKMGIDKSQSKTAIRINQKDIFSQAELSSHLPITIIHPNSLELITGAPSLRRAYIDWLAFYIFPDFYSKWKKYQHVLKQRNICLKSPKHFYALDKWTSELVINQPEIIKYRSQTIELIKPILQKITSVLLPDLDINIDLYSGFPNDIQTDSKSLLDFYLSKSDIDIKFKRTVTGAHKADLKIKLGDISASQSASRGQLKLIAISLLLARSEIILETKSSKGILLIDDLSSELDVINQNKLLNFISDLQLQSIITTTKPLSYDLEHAKMFHVKHGSFSEYQG